MNRTLIALAVIASTALGACSKNNNAHSDSALSSDLSLAAQQKGYTPLDSISAAERANALTTPAPATRSAGGEVATAPVVHHTATRTVHHTSSGSSSGSVGTSSGTVVQSEPRTTTVKHPQRDAAIGAAAGAVLGATTSRNKVKGGIIGAAVGGILGGVIGNNVDKQKKPVP